MIAISIDTQAKAVETLFQLKSPDDIMKMKNIDLGLAKFLEIDDSQKE